MSSLRQILPLCLVAASLGFYATSARSADSEAIIEQIRADWMERFNATETFVYEAEGEMIRPAGSVFHRFSPVLPEEYKKTGYPLEDTSIPYERFWWVNLDQSLIRLKVHYFVFDDDEFRRIEKWKIEAYDGKTLWTGKPDSSKHVTLQPSSRATWFFSVSDFPMFLAHGLIPIGGITYKDLAQSNAQSVSLKYIGTRAINGRLCQVVDCWARGIPAGDVKEFHRFYVDLSRQSAVLRYDQRYHYSVQHYGLMSLNEHSPRWLLDTRIDVEYRKLSGIWIPESWKKTGFRMSSSRIMPDGTLRDPKIQEIVVFEDVTATINEPLERSLFEQPSEAGTIVRDRRGEEPETFQVADDGETLVPVSRVRQGAAPGSLMGYTLAGIGTLCLILAVVVLFRNRSVRGG